MEYILNLLQIFGLFLFFYCTHTLVIEERQDIQVKLKKNPIVFGENVQLDCITSYTWPDFRPKYTAWTQLPSRRTIAYKSSPNPAAKYGVDVNYNTSVLKNSLIIKNFSLSDVNCQYKCDVDFYTSNITLQLNPHNYISIPHTDDITKSMDIKDNALDVDINITNVYPIPVCTFIFENEDLTSKLEVKSKIKKLFYDTSLKLRYKTNKCKGNVNITCSQGQKEFTISNMVTSDKCKELTENDEETVISLEIGILISLLVVGIVICVVFCRKFRRKNYNKGYFLLNCTKCTGNSKHNRGKTSKHLEQTRQSVPLNQKQATTKQQSRLFNSTKDTDNTQQSWTKNFN